VGSGFRSCMWARSRSAALGGQTPAERLAELRITHPAAVGKTA